MLTLNRIYGRIVEWSMLMAHQKFSIATRGKFRDFVIKMVYFLNTIIILAVKILIQYFIKISIFYTKKLIFLILIHYNSSQPIFKNFCF